MARYTEAVCRLCRREGEKLFLKGERCYTDKCGYERRSYPPGQHGQARRRNVDAQCDRATAEAAHGQRVVDLGGAGIVDGEGLHLGQRQIGGRLRRIEWREGGALGEVVEQKALPVKLVA